MSVHPASGAAGWQVRWRDDGGRNRARTFDRKRDAQHFDADLRRRRQAGTLRQLDDERRTLSDLGRDWFELHAAANLATNTRRTYAAIWNAHLHPRLGGVRLRDLTPETIERLDADLRAEGVGPAARRKALALLQTVLDRAVKRGALAANPAVLVKKPPAGRASAIRPLPPAAIERLRSNLRPRDAALVAVLAYAGLRPGEALALRWSDVRERTLLVERAVANGEIKPTKTGAVRTVRLLAPLRADLADWRAKSSPTPADALIFPARDGRPWSEAAWKNWRRRAFDAAARAARLDGTRPYDLRHSYVSLLIHEGASIVEIARQAGHSPTMALSTYGHVFDEFEGSERRSAEAEIMAARGEYVRVKFAAAGEGVRPEKEKIPH